MAEKRFKVQAFSSYVFNMYLNVRIAAGKLGKLLPGDIIVPEDGRYKYRTGPEQDNKERLMITGPVIWDDLKHAKDEALKLEKTAYQKLDLPSDIERWFKKFNIFWIRRPIVIYPSNLSYQRTKDNNLLVRFDLTSGAYASVVVDYLEQKLG